MPADLDSHECVDDRPSGRRRRTILVLVAVLAAGVLVLRFAGGRSSDLRSPVRDADSISHGIAAVGTGAPPAPRIRTISGRVESAFTGSPLARAQVSADGGAASAVSDSSGRFELRIGNAGDSISLGASLLGYLEAQVSVPLPEDAPPPMLVIRLLPLDELNVAVFDGDGRPAGGVVVYGWAPAQSGAGSGVTRDPSARLFQTVTDADGLATVSWPSRGNGDPVLDFVVEAVSKAGFYSSVAIHDMSPERRVIRLPSASSTLDVRPGDWSPAVPNSAEIAVLWNQGDLVLPYRELARGTLSRGSGGSLSLSVPPGLLRVTGGFPSPEWTLAGCDMESAAGSSNVAEMRAIRVHRPGMKGGAVRIVARVHDTEGRPIEGAAVIVRADDPEVEEPFEGVWATKHVMTDGQGRATLVEQAAVGTLLVVLADHPEFELAEETVGLVTAYDVEREIEFALRRRSRHDVVRIRLLGSDGGLIRRASAWWTRDGPRLERGAPEVRATSFPDATHVIGPLDDHLLDELKEGLVTGLAIGAPGHRIQTVSLDWLRSHVGDPLVPEVRLEKPAVVNVTVTANGAPVPRARVTASCIDQGSVAASVQDERVTDQNGLARLELRSPAGKAVWVIARSPHQGAAAVEFDGTRSGVNISMDRPTGQSGSVRFRGAQAAVGAIVHAVPEVLGRPLMNEFVRSTTVRDDGTFALENLISGIPLDITVIFQPKGGGRRITSRASVVAGQESLDFELRE